MGVSSQNVSLVMNSPTLDRLETISRGTSSTLQKGGQALTLIYLGILELPRGLDTVIASLDLLREKLPKLQFRIIGSGRDEEIFRAMVKKKGLLNRVEFVGWIDYKDAIRYIRESDIGLVPHLATESWNTTIPNKLFDYMSMGKPVIVSNAKPTERIVREWRCGVVFKEKDPEDLARAILMLEDQATREEMGQRGKEAVANKYNWTVDEKRLFWALEETFEKRKK
jgi:glycosyltransferase involved in cell wall biosynthesis